MKGSAYLRNGNLRIYPLGAPAGDVDSEGMIEALVKDREQHPIKYEVIIVDAIANLAAYSRERDRDRFLFLVQAPKSAQGAFPGQATSTSHQS